MASSNGKVVILGTGGTIAGTASVPGGDLHYDSAQLGVAQLVAAVPPLAGAVLETEQVAQVDSKDMTSGVWRHLAGRVQFHLDRPDVCGVVVTHGTDTLEETAYLLHRVLAAAKPVVLTAAMRPATSLQADGPQNLLDAVTVARATVQGGVVAVLAGRIWAGCELRKLHGWRVDAFGGGEAGPLGWLEDGRLRQCRGWPAAGGLGVAAVPVDDAQAPWVAVVTSHAGATGREVDALVAAGVRGIVVAATGNGTVHAALRAALERAQASGVQVLRASRCAFGGIAGDAGAGLEAAALLSPPQARVELMLRLAAAR